MKLRGFCCAAYHMDTQIGCGSFGGDPFILILDLSCFSSPSSHLLFFFGGGDIFTHGWRFCLHCTNESTNKCTDAKFPFRSVLLVFFIYIKTFLKMKVCATTKKYGLAAKLTGAGGGGCAFVLVPPSKCARLTYVWVAACALYIYIYMYVFFFQKKKGIRLLSDMYACVHVCVCVLQIVDLSCHAILLLQIYFFFYFFFPRFRWGENDISFSRIEGVWVRYIRNNSWGRRFGSLESRLSRTGYVGWL